MNRIAPAIWIVLLAVGVVGYWLLIGANTATFPSVEHVEPALAKSATSRSDATATSGAHSRVTDGLSSSDVETDEVKEHSRWVQAVVASLVTRNDADALLAAAVLQFHDHARAMPLLERAAALAPSEPAIRWLMWMECYESKECDRLPYESAMRAADAESGFGWFGALERAEGAGDPGAIERALSDLAARKRFDMYKPKIDSVLYTVINDARVTPPKITSRLFATSSSDAAMYLSNSAVVALPLPPLQVVTAPCREPATTSIREHCKQLGTAMRNADTVIIQIIGASMRGRWAPPGSEDSKDFIETRRRYTWLQYNLSLLRPSIEHTQFVQSETGGEMQAYQAILKKNGIPLEPPDDWTKQ